MAGAFDGLTGAPVATGNPLAQQIRQLWGGYGDWNQGGIDHAAELAQILSANGITDLGALSFRDYSYLPGGQYAGGDSGDGTYSSNPTETQIQAVYGGKGLGYLGNINDDGTFSQGVDPFKDGDAVNLGDNHSIGWSAQGHGNTSFVPFKKADGSYGVAPVWGSSSQDDYETGRGIASILALAAGAYYAPAGGTAGAMAQGGLKGAAMAMGGNMVANPNGSVDSLVKSGLKGGVTGAAGAGVSQYAQQAGWSPATTGAVKGATGAALGGGSGGDILKGALTGGAGSYANGLQLTDDPAMNKALLAGGTSLLKGNGWGSALGSAALGYMGTGTGAPAGGGNVSDEFNLDGINFGSGDFNSGSGLDLSTFANNPSWYGGGGLDGGEFNYDSYFGPGSNFANWQNNYDPTAWGGATANFGYSLDADGNPVLGNPSITAGDNWGSGGTSPNWWDKAGGALKSLFQGNGKGGGGAFGGLLGNALMTGGALALSKNAKQGPADPMLLAGGAGVTGIADAAKGRATSADQLFMEQFLPKYLANIDQAQGLQNRLVDYNMAQAKKSGAQMDKFYGAVDSFDNEGERERIAGRAGATAEQQNSSAMEQMQRNLQRMGVNPNSGVMVSQMRQQGQNGALAKTMAMNMTREAARREGMNMRAAAAGLRGADQGYLAGAQAASGLGLGALNSANAGLNANNASWNSTMGLANGAYGALGGWGLSRSNSADQLSAANVAGYNGILGYGLGQMWNGGTKTTPANNGGTGP